MRFGGSSVAGSVERRPFHLTSAECRILRTLCATASAAGISSHGNALLQFLDILEVLDRTLDLPAVDGLGGLAGVLEADTQVGASRAGALRRGDVLRSVTDLQELESVSC